MRYVLWAATEECLKLLAVTAVALHTRFNDEPIDAMVYCIVVALGFAALENTLFVLDPISKGSIAQSILTDNMRFLGATLVHVVSTAMVGFGLGYAFYKNHFVKFICAALGLAAGITIHAAFNLSIVNTAPADTLKIFAWVWCAIIFLLIFFEEVKMVVPKTPSAKIMHSTRSHSQ